MLACSVVSFALSFVCDDVVGERRSKMPTCRSWEMCFSSSLSCGAHSSRLTYSWLFWRETLPRARRTTRRDQQMLVLYQCLNEKHDFALLGVVTHCEYLTCDGRSKRIPESWQNAVELWQAYTENMRTRCVCIRRCCCRGNGIVESLELVPERSG